MRIDPHVHFRDEEEAYKETIAHGMQLARNQGVDIVFDMPNTKRPVIYKRDLQRRMRLVPKEFKDKYFCYLGVTRRRDQLISAIRLVQNYQEAIALKLYAGKSIGNLAITNPKDQLWIYRTLVRHRYTGVLAVHCEKESLMEDVFDPNRPITHAWSRPKEAEIQSVIDQIGFAIEVGFQGTLHICHVSCPESVELVDKARKHIKITCGVTPHHLMWDESKLESEDGLLYKMNPPLRSKEDVKKLLEMLKKGKFDWIETDHAPHSIGEKVHEGFLSGYPSLYLYQSLINIFLPAQGFSKEQIDNLTYWNIARAFGLI